MVNTYFCRGLRQLPHNKLSNYSKQYTRIPQSVVVSTAFFDRCCGHVGLRRSFFTPRFPPRNVAWDAGGFSGANKIRYKIFVSKSENQPINVRRGGGARKFGQVNELSPSMVQHPPLSYRQKKAGKYSDNPRNKPGADLPRNI